jgi:hypothetical protein
MSEFELAAGKGEDDRSTGQDLPCAASRHDLNESMTAFRFGDMSPSVELHSFAVKQ